MIPLNPKLTKSNQKMPSINKENVALNPIKTKPSHEDMFCSGRRLSQEHHSIRSDNSLEVYYRDGPVGVPFLWEARPGTPKIKSRDTPLLPPLTPPPSYQSSPMISRKTAKKHQKNNLLPTMLLPKFNLVKSELHHSPPRSSTSTTSSSPWSLRSAPSTPSGLRHRGFSSPRMSVDSRRELCDHNDCESPVSILCFRAGRGSSGGRSTSRGSSSSFVKMFLREFSR